jgi:hypothetical protein
MFRITPALGVGAYQTYSITAPHDRTVRAACEEVGCAAWLNGWQSKVDESTELGQRQAAYIRQQSGRTFREQRTGEGLTVFTFDSRQRCFADHRTRPEVYAVRDGDWRGNPTGRTRTHQSAADWTEDFGEHQQRIADQIERG